MAYIRGSERRQNVLFPSSLDDYVGEDNPARVIAAFIDALDFQELGFVRGEAAETGRPGYDPRLLMGLFIWGHMNRVRTSRKLERECGRNVEVMWLMENLRPDFKTIADFRRDNGEPIKQVVVRFRLWCMGEGLYGREMVAIDGSKFKAVNNRDRNFTRKKLENFIKEEQKRVDNYLKAIEEADQQDEEEKEGPLSIEELKEKLGRIKEKLAGHEELLKEMKEAGESQVSLTDEDARLMKTARGSEVGYNVQTVVDDKHKLIAEYDVTNERNDVGQLARMAKKAKEALGVEELVALVDSGYFDGDKIKECEEAGITPYLPVPNWKTAERRGLFGSKCFKYDEERDVHVCPQGEELSFRTTEKRKGKKYKIYRTDACGTCPLRAQCTTSKVGRKLRIWVDRHVLDRLRERNRSRPELINARKKIAEHPFGTIKWAMDQGYFLLKGATKVSIEMGLTVLAHNLKRVINIMGVENMITRMNEAIA
jgi:transposase